MQNINIHCVMPGYVYRYGDLFLTREVRNIFTVTLLTGTGTAFSTTGIAAWELGITQDFYAATPLLASTGAIIADDNVLTVALNGNTVELAEILDGKKSLSGYATLKGFDAGAQAVSAFVFPVVLQNVGYDADAELAHAVEGLHYTAAQVDAMFSDIAGTVAGDPAFAALLAAKEDAANKVATIDAEDPSADKFPSEAAVVAYVGGALTSALGDIDAALDALIGGTP